MTFQLPQILPAGQVGWRGPGVDDLYVRELASLEDWVECLEAARKCFSLGSKAIPAGMSWEEALALLGKRFLEAGADEPGWGAMGRPDPWPDGEEERWVDAVFATAGRGSTNCTQHWDGEAWQFEPSHTVLVEPARRVPLTDIPRSQRMG